MISLVLSLTPFLLPCLPYSFTLPILPFYLFALFLCFDLDSLTWFPYKLPLLSSWFTLYLPYSVTSLPVFPYDSIALFLCFLDFISIQPSFTLFLICSLITFFPNFTPCQSLWFLWFTPFSWFSLLGFLVIIFISSLIYSLFTLYPIYFTPYHSFWPIVLLLMLWSLLLDFFPSFPILYYCILVLYHFSFAFLDFITFHSFT